MSKEQKTWPRLTTLDWQDMNMPMVNASLAIEGQVVDVADDNGWTGLMYASRYCPNQYVAQRLIASGANVNARNNDGCTPLMVAAGHNNLDVIRTLVDAGAAIFPMDEALLYALDYAASSNYPEVIEYMIVQMQKRGNKIDWHEVYDHARDNPKLHGSDIYCRIQHETRYTKRSFSTSRNPA